MSGASHLWSSVAVLLILATFVIGETNANEVNLDTAVSQAIRRPCLGRCRFIMCRRSQTILFGTPVDATGPSVCRRGQDIGLIKRIGEALVKEGSTLTPISKWKPAGLEKSFPAKFFLPKKTFSVEEMSTIVKRSSIGNQNDFVDGRCFVIPIQAYERNFSTGVKVVKTSDQRDCLSFVAFSPDVVIEGRWFSGDDMDLSVVEPDGDRISNENLSSECGKLNGDNNVDSCGRLEAGKERVTYSFACPDFQRGTYRAILKHGGNCGLGSTKWEVNIIVQGRLHKRVTGNSNRDGGVTVANVKFTL